MMKIARTAAAGSLLLLVSAGWLLADAKSEFEKLYGAEAKKVLLTASKKDDAAFAGKLLHPPRAVRKNSELRVLVYEKAYEFAVRDASGYKTALRALGILWDCAPQRRDEWEEKHLKVYELRYRHSKGEDRPRAGRYLLYEILKFADRHVAAGEATGAMALYRRAKVLSTAMKGRYKSRIEAGMKAAAAMLPVERRMVGFRMRLKKDPADHEARDGLIRLYVLELNDPPKAVKLITEDTDEHLRTYVPLAAKPVGELDKNVCIELAQWYRTHAPKITSPMGKSAAYRRAEAYYLRFLSLYKTEDINRLKVIVALGQVQSEMKKLGLNVSEGLSERPKGAVMVLTFDKDTLGDTEGRTVARDLSGNENHAVARGATWTEKGKSGGAFSFDGVDDYLDCGNGGKLNIKGPMSISMWVNLRKWDEGGGLCAKGTGKGGESYLLDMTGYSRVRFVRRPSSEVFKYVTSSGRLHSGSWNHIVAVADGAQLRLYLNNQQTVGAAYSSESLINDHVVTLGSRQSGKGDYDANVAGKIDEVAIWPRALSPAEVAKLYEMGKRGQSLK